MCEIVSHSDQMAIRDGYGMNGAGERRYLILDRSQGGVSTPAAQKKAAVTR